MTSTVSSAVLAALLAAAPAAAQSSEAPVGHFPLVPRETTPVASRGLSLPVASYADQDGIITKKRGIVFGREVAPNTMVGVGLFDRAPRPSTFTPPIDSGAAPKRSRSVAIGFKLSF